MQLYAAGVNSAGFAYRGDHQNSNTFASGALQAGDLPAATGVAHDPAGPAGELLEFFAPGLNELLRAPIGQTSSYEPVNGVQYASATNPDGSTTYTGEGGSSYNGTIAKVSLHTNSDNVVDQIVTDGKDGTKTSEIRDIGDRETWSAQTTKFDSQTRAEAIETLNDDGTSKLQEYDPQNTHPYNELDFTKAADGKVTAAQVTLDQNVLNAGMSVGQVFGSALGGALGGNDLAGRLVGSAVGGLIGQKFVQVLATSMTADLSQVSLADVFAGQGINIAGAGIGAVSSFLTAELGTALHIGGFGGTLFNIAGSSLTFSVLSQVANSNLTFDAAIAAIDWSQAVSGAFNAAQLNLDGVLGGYLAHEFVPAKTHEGAVGGELLGAIGNLILPGGLGSFIGTLLGTLIFNHFGTSPSPGAVDLLDQAGYYYNSHQYQASDHGTYDFPDKMAPAADTIINAYLGAVKGVALDHSKQAILGYIVNPDLLFISGTPGHPDHSFTNADDAVHAAALDVLQHTEVIGGDLLLKRAHQASISGPHTDRKRGANARRHLRASGWRRAQRATASMDCICKRSA
jgi:hypothetical protein